MGRGGETFLQKGFSSPPKPTPPLPKTFDLIESLISSGGMAAFWGEKLLIRRGLLGTIIMFLYFIVFILNNKHFCR